MHAKFADNLLNQLEFIIEKPTDKAIAYLDHALGNSQGRQQAQFQVQDQGQTNLFES